MKFGYYLLFDACYLKFSAPKNTDIRIKTLLSCMTPLYI